MNLYFKVLSGNPVFEALKALFEKKSDAFQTQKDFCEKMGCNTNYLIDSDGRMIAVQFENGKPEGWKKYDKYYPYHYQPKVNNPIIRGEFWNLPYVKRQDWNDIIDFKPTTTAEDRGLVRHGGYACTLSEDGTMYLLEINSACQFNREHLIEITGTEYLELTKPLESTN